MKMTERARITGNDLDVTVSASVGEAKPTNASIDTNMIVSGGKLVFYIHNTPAVLPLYEEPSKCSVQFSRWRKGGNYKINSAEPYGHAGRLLRVECERK